MLPTIDKQIYATIVQLSTLTEYRNIYRNKLNTLQNIDRAITRSRIIIPIPEDENHMACLHISSENPFLHARIEREVRRTGKCNVVRK